MKAIIRSIGKLYNLSKLHLLSTIRHKHTLTHEYIHWKFQCIQAIGLYRKRNSHKSNNYWFVFCKCSNKVTSTSYKLIQILWMRLHVSSINSTHTQTKHTQTRKYIYIIITIRKQHTQHTYTHIQINTWTTYTPKKIRQYVIKYTTKSIKLTRSFLFTIWIHECVISNACLPCFSIFLFTLALLSSLYTYTHTRIQMYTHTNTKT